MNHNAGLTTSGRILKRCFDILFAAAVLVLTFWIISIAWILAAIDTRKSGFFTQHRIGLNGRRFNIIKIRTMRDTGVCATNVTCDRDPRITRVGRFLRKTKIDELPQFINVLIGDMSIVGPRPDVPGMADMLSGDDRIILSVRPGITGPATLKYRYEEKLLGAQKDPERYSQEIIYPDKVCMNKEYVSGWTFWGDIKYILETVALILSL